MGGVGTRLHTGIQGQLQTQESSTTDHGDDQLRQLGEPREVALTTGGRRGRDDNPRHRRRSRSRGGGRR